MRNAFAQEILKIALEDPRIVVLSGDIGNRLFDPFKAALPARFYNCGVAEANMMSMAAGLAASGLRPVCYTITPFVTTRCLEQIKLDVCYHGMPVTIVGTGCGLSYAALGTTHHSFEDLAELRVLPGLQIAAPADPPELRAALRRTFSDDKPTYLRIGKKGEPVLTDPALAFEFGKWRELRPGGDAILLACGTVLAEALAAADLLAANGIAAAIWNCASVKPLDESALASFPDVPVMTIEEHSVIGGFGSAVADFYAGRGIARRLVRCGIPDQFLHDCGEQEHARVLCGIDARSLAQKVRGMVSPLP
jgi:transketolase